MPRDPAGNSAPPFSEIDTAHRGKVRRADIPKDVPALRQLRMHFAEADMDHDGWLTAEEYFAYTQN
ncbi:MAG: EF-hand domain-containing protein [Dyella sp.]|uniref:EF-hand domain-containing protein n=1 Tax=Dyella sp. TaxID=1869338 RepID=UPI003F8216CE